jgi:hypothetical protein
MFQTAAATFDDLEWWASALKAARDASQVAASAAA